jgi:4'-phosphopantetheinyl transferase
MALHPELETTFLKDLDGSLPDNEVHVLRADLTIPQTGLDTLRELLAPEELERAAQFKLSVPRSQFLVTRAFLRLALGRYLPIGARELQFRTTRYGKPELSQFPDLRFNLSHSGNVAVLAITRCRQVGIDVEQIRDEVNPMELASRFFSRQEVKWLQAQPDSERLSSFFACWTAKEAYVKARGQGLSMPLNSFGVIPIPGSSRLNLETYDNPGESGHWLICQLQLGTDLRGALAVEDVNCRVCMGRWPSKNDEVKKN